MNHMPDILVSTFVGSHEQFLAKAKKYFETNADYRGYEQILELIGSKNLGEYELFEVLSDDIPAGVAAAKLVGKTIILDVFVIDEGFRGYGVGDQLFGEITANPKFKDATNYESMALPGDRSTKNFFEQRKGKARLLIVGGIIQR
ncbi:MAG TPA: hypothetical protein PLT55_02085 [Acidimicrobiia bacterium]|nr:hypothetical protein [Acidimicrobiia bacterium]